VANREYIEQLQSVILHLHACKSSWVETVPVHEVFGGETVWRGDVEVFDLIGHPQAKRCYAWSHLDGPKDERTRFVAVLEIPPVESAETAVRVQIVNNKTGAASGDCGGSEGQEMKKYEIALIVIAMIIVAVLITIGIPGD
jgi:hypothetical protein